MVLPPKRIFLHAASEVGCKSPVAWMMSRFQCVGRHVLYFGVSLHSDHAWSWYEPSQRHDTKGPKKGIPYDGKLTKEDGKGKWWEGYDPQELYAQNHPLSENSWDKIVIKSLSESSRLLNGKINEVELLGCMVRSISSGQKKVLRLICRRRDLMK